MARRPNAATGNIASISAFIDRNFTINVFRSDVRYAPRIMLRMKSALKTVQPRLKTRTYATVISIG